MLDWGSEVPLQSKVKTDCRMKELLMKVFPQCNPNVLQYVGFFPFFVGTLHFLHWTILSCWTDIFLSGSSPQNISHSGSTVQLWGTHTQKIEHFQFGYIIKTKRKYWVFRKYKNWQSLSSNPERNLTKGEIDVKLLFEMWLTTGKPNVMFVDVKKSSITKCFSTQKVCSVFFGTFVVASHRRRALPQAPLSLINRFIYTKE